MKGIRFSHEVIDLSEARIPHGNHDALCVTLSSLAHVARVDQQ